MNFALFRYYGPVIYSRHAKRSDVYLASHHDF